MYKKYMVIVLIILFSFNNLVFAESTTEIANVEGAYIKTTDPQIIKNLQDTFSDIQRWVLTLSTPAAIIGIGTGVFMKKFSFGEEERIIVGKKLIRNSIVSYILIVASGLILQAIRMLIGVSG